MEALTVSTVEHYDSLVDEGKDPVHYIDILKAYVARWDGGSTKSDTTACVVEGSHDICNSIVRVSRSETRMNTGRYG